MMDTVWNVFNSMTTRLESLASDNQELRKRNESLNLQLLRAFDREESVFAENKEKIQQLQILTESQEAELVSVKLLLEQEKMSRQNLMKVTEQQKLSNDAEVNFLKERLLSANRKCLHDQELLDKLKSEVNMFKVEKSDLMLELQKLSSKLKALELDVEDSKKSCDVLIHSVEEVINCNKLLESQLTDNSHMLKSAQTTIEEKNDEIDSYFQEVHQLKELHEKVLAQHCLEESEKLAEIAVLKQEVTVLSQAVDSKDEENYCLRGELLRCFEELQKTAGQLSHQMADEKADVCEVGKTEDTKLD